ncbi:MAG: RNA polymerase II transcription factor B 52 kDa subunit [Alyxoria varia]|nr:MAG: RNA polymerase II transcription factor B 52 kDa subunit [Alyxoria varia]
MAMLFMRDPYPVPNLDTWVRAESKREQDQAIELLERLHILATIQDPGKPRAYRLSKPFVTTLRLALTGGGDHGSFGVPCDSPGDDKVDIHHLDDFSRRKWEGILYYIVGSAGGNSQPTSNIATGSKNLLEWGGFIETKGKASMITETGFTFLLQEVNTQVWSLLIVYLENADRLGMDNIELLSFLFTLGSLEVGQDYSTSTLSRTQSSMLEDLNDLGIVYKDHTATDRFYPTRLATTLTSDSNALVNSMSTSTASISAPGGSETNQRGFIIVETNFRIYAYTDSPLRISVLSLFTKLHTQYPNMVSGKITKGSVRRALATGITANQIVSYLTAHAHPVMRLSGNSNRQQNPYQDQSVLPPTVVDQIRLWQLEGDRMQATSGFLFKEFNSETQYKDCIKLADTIGVLVWRDDSRRYFFVTKHEQVAAFLKKQQAKNAQNASGSGKTT